VHFDPAFRFAHAGYIDTTDLPDGLSRDSAVQPHQRKYFASSFGRNSIIDSGHPASQEGRIAIVTDVGRGMRWTLITSSDE
jgi:hypothetical protein